MGARFAAHSRVLSSFASLATRNRELPRSLKIVGTLRCCYTERFAATIFSATPRCNIVATLFRLVATFFQYCNAVLRLKSSLRIVPCNTTFRQRERWCPGRHKWQPEVDNFSSFSDLTRQICITGVKRKAFRFVGWDRSVPSSETSNIAIHEVRDATALVA